MLARSKLPTENDPWFVVKNLDSGALYCGSMSSIAPKLYTKGHAEAAKNRLNSYSYGATRNWVVVPCMLALSTVATCSPNGSLI